MKGQCNMYRLKHVLDFIFYILCFIIYANLCFVFTSSIVKIFWALLRCERKVHTKEEHFAHILLHSNLGSH